MYLQSVAVHIIYMNYVCKNNVCLCVTVFVCINDSKPTSSGFPEDFSPSSAKYQPQNTKLLTHLTSAADVLEISSKTI